MQLVKYMAEYY